MNTSRSPSSGGLAKSKPRDVVTTWARSPHGPSRACVGIPSTIVMPGCDSVISNNNQQTIDVTAGPRLTYQAVLAVEQSSLPYKATRDVTLLLHNSLLPIEETGHLNRQSCFMAGYIMGYLLRSFP